MNLSLYFTNIPLEEVKAATLYLFESPSMEWVSFSTPITSSLEEITEYLNKHRYKYTISELPDRLILSIIK